MMNNAWATIACRAHCAAAPTQRKPLLQLFSSFRRYESQYARRGSTWLKEPVRPSRPFSASAFLSGKSRVRTPAKSLKPKPRSKVPEDSKIQPVEDAKIQPATVSASHTEGILECPKDDESEPTWRDYDPEGGMPLPVGELPRPDIREIFGSEDMDTDMGNYILSVIHWRRMSGALIDIGLDFPREREVSRDQALRALQYVRALDPGFDEQAAGGAYAEEESERLREELRQRAVNLKLYKSNEPEPEVEEQYEKEPDQGTEWGRQRNSESVLQQTRLANEARYEQELAEKEAQKEREERAAVHSARGPLELAGGVQPIHALTSTGVGDVSITGGQTKAWLQPVERKEWVKYYEKQAEIIKENVVPQLSILRRLAPSFLLTLLTLSACFYASENYTPPPKSARMFSDLPPAVATLGGITGIMLSTFVLSRMPILWRANNKFFTVVPAYPYALSLLGATWRHDTVYHLASNLVTLWLFGLSLHEEIGRGTFLAIFLGSGVVGGYTSLAFNVARKNWMSYIFGSSGAVLGIVGASCAIQPNGTLRILGYDLPLAAWMAIGVFGALEVYGLVKKGKTNIDHAGHLGGIASGVVAAVYLRKKAAERAAADSAVMRAAPAFIPAAS